MKRIVYLFTAAMLVLVSADSVSARHVKSCHKQKGTTSYTECSTEMPLLYSDTFDVFDSSYWATKNDSVRQNRNGWIQFRHDTITSLDYIDQNLTDFRIILRFKAWNHNSPQFAIHFTTGEEILFSYQKMTVPKRKRHFQRKMFAMTAYPEIETTSIKLNRPFRWDTLMVVYDSIAGTVSLDTDNDCDFDQIISWETGLQFSHVTASNQAWDLFELYGVQGKKADETSSEGLPVYQLEWSGIGDASKGLAVDSTGNVYVSCPSNYSMKKFDGDGNLLAEWQGIEDPRGIAIDENNNFYVADTGSNNIKKYNSDGTILSILPTYGDAYGSLSNVQDIAIDSEGIVYVPSFNMWFGPKVFKFTTDWEFIGEISLPNDMIASGIAVDGDGNIYLAGDGGIQKYDSTGAYVMDIGTVSGGTGDGEFSTGCADIFIDANGLIYATDGGDNNRIQVFNSDGAYQYAWGTTGNGNGEFVDPSRIAVTSAGIYILDAGNGRVQKFQ